MKEILDKSGSFEAVAEILAPYARLQNQEHNFSGILNAIHVHFQNFAAEKAETVPKRKVTGASKVAQRLHLFGNNVRYKVKIQHLLY
jgi:hypothetical protein